ncbi:MAG: hypothetical protein ACMX3H_18870, partial [Sodalis sp. (in: enterobacteria)]|uniref:hypothetical protein n=1 Tax=Sodalis sp. (in: enterobacteria) TaxID=1898979 RepID=UPI0039E2C238
MRIDAALANVTPLLTPVPSRPSKNAQPDASTGTHPAMQSASPPRRLQSPQRATTAGAHPFMKSPSSPVTLRRPRHDPAAVASQAPPRPPKPSPLPARTLGDASLIYAQIDHEALPTFRSTGTTFVPYDKTVYAALHSPAPLITDVNKAPDGRVHSWINFSVERKKHAAFEALMWGGNHFRTLKGNVGLAGSLLLARLTAILRILDSSQKNERKMSFLHY